MTLRDQYLKLVPVMPSTSKRPSRQIQLNIRKESLLSAAIAVIGRKGLIGTTMHDIAKEAGCSYGVVAFHYKSKDGVLLAALDEIVEEYKRIWSEHDKNHQNAASRLRAIIEADFDARVSSPERVSIWMAFWAEAARNEAYRKRCALLKKRYQGIAAECVLQLARKYRVNVVAAEIASALNAMSDGFWIAQQVFGRPEHRVDARLACLSYLRLVFPQEPVFK
jgi:TetR/AcrR family transcriptional regulator, transcriptional repressor of bet genes